MVQNFAEILPDPPEEIFTVFYIRRTQSVEGTLLPNDFHASSLTHANLKPLKSVSQNRRQ